MQTNLKYQLNQVVQEAFKKTHDGYSPDEVIIQDELNRYFIEACREQLPSTSEFILNWSLQKLRKQGKLGHVTTKRIKNDHSDYAHASEIAARLMYDKYKLSVDRILCDPEHRREFDTIAAQIAPNVSNYLLRKAALKLRKAHKLKPELVVRIASWGKEILVFPADEVAGNPDLIPRKPGIYIFRDASGYLYIGESKDVQFRVRKHLDHSDRKSLAHYFWENGITEVTIEIHAFDPNSEARLTANRRAYESNLIQSRHPKFNIQP